MTPRQRRLALKLLLTAAVAAMIFARWTSPNSAFRPIPIEAAKQR
jgi:hypothetical protein